METYNPPLQVVGLFATTKHDGDRGPAIRIRRDDATLRLIDDRELVWVYGPRRHELATAIIDDTLPRGCVVVRDILGAAPSEIVRVVKTNTDRPMPNGKLA